MRIVFVTPASNLRRSLPFRVGFYAYGHPDAITGPLILGHILKTPCHSADVMTTRGCPYGKCTFCTSARMFTPYRERSVESVLDELRYYKQLGFRYVNFEDDNFTANKGRAKAICRGMIENNLVFGETFFFGRVDMGTDEEMLDLLERAHLTYALIGIESLNPDALAEIDKGQQPADIERCAQALSRHKIRLIASLVLGIDTDTPEDILNSVAFASRIGAYQLQPAILTPFPGTPIRAQFEQEGRMITDRWSLYDMMNVVYVPKRMTPWQLQDLFFESAERFYTFSSSFDIMKRFGPSFGMRRMSLWAFSRLGGAAGRAVSKTVRQSHYYALRHDYAAEGEPVREVNDGAARRQDAHATLRTVALAAAGAGVAIGIAGAKVVGDRPLAQAIAKAGSFA